MEQMDVFYFIFDYMGDIINTINSVELAGVPYFYLIFAFIVTSICISVFWRGGRG